MKPRVVLGYCAVLSALLSGCKNTDGVGNWCSVTAHFNDVMKANAKTYAIVFEELRGQLVVRMVQCGEQEFYVGSEPSASSANLPKPDDLQRVYHDPTFSCQDIHRALPDDSPKTIFYAGALCDALFQLNKKATDAAIPVN
jgi:hypothetical protein